jgi:alpha-ribazole phosphatase
VIPVEQSSQTLKRPTDCTIFLLRHGAVQSTGSGKRYIGHTDLPLSDIGREQAHRWAGYFSDAGLKDIYSSDLSRCLETARIIAARGSLEPRALPEFREISLGAWEGQPFDTIKTLYPEEFELRGDCIADHRPPGGESFRDMQDRVWPNFQKIARQRAGNTLIVTHAGVIRVLICRLLDMSLDRLFSIGQAYGALNIIEVRTKGYRIQALNLPIPEYSRPEFLTPGNQISVTNGTC